MIRAVKTGRKA